MEREREKKGEKSFKKRRKKVFDTSAQEEATLNEEATLRHVKLTDSVAVITSVTDSLSPGAGPH